jgi:hypothetical protein
MPATPESSKRKRSTIHRWISRGFIVWAIFATAWLANSVRTQGVDASFLKNSATVSVVDQGTRLEFLPTRQQDDTGLIFFCGSGIAAEAYAPLLRPIAETGYPVHVIRLPWRFAPLESHKREAVERAIRLIQDHPEVSRWVVSGHSLGGALACRAVQSQVTAIAGVVLLGTTHPKKDDLSGCLVPLTKVFASNDRIAPLNKVLANKHLLPPSTTWAKIEGGNHSQFGHYGHQLFDGTATISRSEQQSLARSSILDVVRRIAGGDVE